MLNEYLFQVQDEGKSKSKDNDNEKEGRALAASPQNGGLGFQAIHPLLEPEARSRLGIMVGLYLRSDIQCTARAQSVMGHQPILQVGCPLCSRSMRIELARINQQKSTYPVVDPTSIKVFMASVLQ